MSDLLNRVRDYFDPPSPSNQRPQRRSGGGASRSPLCLNAVPAIPLVALVPEEDDAALTVQQSPTLWFYSPYSEKFVEEYGVNDARLYLELLVTDLAGSTELYSGRFPLPDQSGISHISLPISIEENRGYWWYLDVTCWTGDSLRDINIASVYSSVYRISADEKVRNCISETRSGIDRDEREAQAVECYARADLWYDMLTGLAQLSCGEDTIDWTPLLTQNDVELDEELKELENDGQLRFGDDQLLDAEEALMEIARAPLTSFCNS